MTCLFCGYILLVFSVFRMAAEHVECFVPQALKCLEKTFLLFKSALPTGPPAFPGRPTAGLAWRSQIRGPARDSPKQPISDQHQPTRSLLADQDHQKGPALCGHIAWPLRQVSRHTMGPAFSASNAVSLDSYRISHGDASDPRLHPTGAYQPGRPIPPLLYLRQAYGL